MDLAVLRTIRDDDERALLDRLAADVAEQLRFALREDGRATLCVSGRLPVRFFRTLAAEPLEWAHTFVTLTDDRWVGPDHPESLQRVVRRELLRGPASAARLIGLFGGGPLAEAAPRWRPPAFATPFDVVVVDVDPSGAVGGLFPGSRAWREALRTATEREAFAVSDGPDGCARVALTPHRLARTQLLAIHAAPPAEPVLDAALAAGDADEHPLRWLLSRPDTTVVVYRTGTHVAS